MDQSSINPDVRARIIAAIEKLYDELGRGDKYPTVRDVRDEAGADMNSTSVVVREWKRQQTAKPALIAVDVPEPVKHAHIEAVAIVWTAAQEQANASLREAEAKWEQERADNETMRRELADAYETAVADAEQARSTLAEALRTKELLTQQNQTLSQQLAESREALAQQTTRADENERRANDLKDELQLAHGEVASVRQELTQVRLSHLAEVDQQKAVAAEQIEGLSEKLATVKGRLEAATEQLESRSTEIHQLQGQLAHAEAQASSASAELERVRASLQERQREAESLQQQLATLTVRAEAAEGLHTSQHSELRSAHSALQVEFEKTRQAADESSRELAKVSGILQEVQRQNAELMARLVPAKPARAKKPAAKSPAGKT